MRLKLISFLFVFIAVTLAVFPIEAFKVTGASLSVSEREYSGSCPHRFTFTGRITTNRGGTVRYRWLRSDGSRGAETALVFTMAGTKTVSTYWQLGGTMGTYPDRWMQLEITAPNSRTSNKAVFDLKCIPQVRLERKIYKVSGRVIAVGNSHVEWLNGLQVKVKLANGTRTVSTSTVTFANDGICRYTLILFNAPGRYRVTVEPVHPTDPAKFHLCYGSPDPATIWVELTEAAPEAINKNFDLSWSWRHLDMNQEAFDSPCW